MTKCAFWLAVAANTIKKRGGNHEYEKRIRRVDGRNVGRSSRYRGVISGRDSGFNSAMNSHKANTLLNEASKRATSVAAQFTMQG